MERRSSLNSRRKLRTQVSDTSKPASLWSNYYQRTSSLYSSCWHTSRPRPRLLARGSRRSVRPLESALKCSWESRPETLETTEVCPIEQHTDVGAFCCRGEFITFTWSSSVPQIAAVTADHRKTGRHWTLKTRGCLSIPPITVRISRVRWLPTDTPASPHITYSQ